MREFGKDAKKVIWLVAGLFVLFLAIRYWSLLEGIVHLGIDAATPLLIGCVIAYAVNILMNFYEKIYDRLFKVAVAKKIKRIVCIIFAFLSLIGIVLFVINMVLPELINCIASFIRMIPDAVNWLVEFVGEERLQEYFPFLQAGFDFSTISTQIEELIKSVLNGVGGAVGSIVTALTSMVSVIISIVIGLIFSLYVLIDKERLCAQCKRIVETYLPKKSEKILYVTRVVNNSFHSFIVGQVTEAVILGILCIIGMTICRFPYAVMIGVFIGFTALIPIAGAYIGAGVGAVLMLTTDPLLAVEFLVFIVILQQLEGNLIYPRVVGNSIGLPGIWVLTAVTVGGGVLGIGGMLLAVPLAAAGYRLLREDLNRRQPEQECVEETETEEVTKAEEVPAEHEMPETEKISVVETPKKKFRKSGKKVQS